MDVHLMESMWIGNFQVLFVSYITHYISEQKRVPLYVPSTMPKLMKARESIYANSISILCTCVMYGNSPSEWGWERMHR